MVKNGDDPAESCQVEGSQEKHHDERDRTGRRGAGECAADHEQLTAHREDQWDEIEAQSDGRDPEVGDLADRSHVEEEKPLVGQWNP